MKKAFNLLIFSALFVCALSFGSCEKDNDASSSFSKDNIVGSWEFTGSSGWIKENGNIVEQWQSISYKTMGDEQDVITEKFVQRTGDVWKFKDDGMFAATINGSSATASYTVSGNKLTFTGSWRDKWNDRQVSEVVFVIKELKADKLAVSFQGEAGDAVFYEEYTFKKI